MTAGATTARVWLAAAGTVTGTWLSSRGIASRSALAAAAVGLGLVWLRRHSVAAAVGIFVLVLGVAALRPVEVPDLWRVSSEEQTGRFHRALWSGLSDADYRSAGLVAGLTIGDTSRIDDGTTETFRRSGLAHLVAVSGSNVAIVLAAIAVVTARLPIMVRAALGLIGLGLYVSVVGPEPSVLRAAAMGVVALVAYVSGRHAAPLNSLGIAVIAVLAFKPELLFAIGLHLSIAATFGIVVWSRPISAALDFLPGVLRAPIAITLAAQLAVAPLLLGAFERVSVVAPVANVLAAAAVPPATVLGLGAGIVEMVWPGAAHVLGSAAALCAEWILWVADRTAAWRWATVAAPAWTGWVVGVPIAALGAVTIARGPGGSVGGHGRVALGPSR